MKRVVYYCIVGATLLFASSFPASAQDAKRITVIYDRFKERFDRAGLGSVIALP